MASVLDHPIVSDQINRQELAVIVRECRNVIAKGVEGDIVELGCYVGTTSLFLQRLILQDAPAKTLHVYDSFAGLPHKLPQDQSPAGEQFKGGELAAARAQLVKHFRRAGLRLPIIHKGWFEDLTPNDMPERIGFAFLDGDFYGSILASLRVVWPRLAPGATVVIDDYQTEALPGVRQAVKEWSHNHSFKLRVEASLAIITPTRLAE